MSALRIERVVVTGGRRFADLGRIEADLRALVRHGLRRVAHGGASGADRLADTFWRYLKALPLGEEVSTTEAETKVYPADWDADGRAGGPRRNVRMLEAERPDLVLAYPDPDSRGTWHCVREAVERDMTVAVWSPHPRPVCLPELGRRVGMPVTILDEAPRFIVARQGYPARGWSPGYLLSVAEVLRGT